MKFKTAQIVKHKIFKYKVKILSFKNGKYLCNMADKTPVMKTILHIKETNLEELRKDQ